MTHKQVIERNVLEKENRHLGDEHVVVELVAEMYPDGSVVHNVVLYLSEDCIKNISHPTTNTVSIDFSPASKREAATLFRYISEFMDHTYAAESADERREKAAGV